MENKKILETYDNYLKMINTYIDELKSKGIGVTYYEDEIAMINIETEWAVRKIIGPEKYKYYQNSINKLEGLYFNLCKYYLMNLKDSLDNNMGVIDNVKNINTILSKNKNKNEDRLSKLEKELKIRVVSLILAISTTVSLGSVLAFKIGKEKVFNTTTTTYYEGDYEPYMSSNYLKKMKDDKVYLTIKEPYEYVDNNMYESIIKTYDLSNIKLEDIKDYFNLDLSKEAYESDTDTKSLFKLTGAEIKGEEQRILTTIEQDKNKYDYINHYDYMIMFILGYLAFITLLYASISDSKDSYDIFSFNEINRRIDKIKKYISMLDNKIESNKDIIKNIYKENALLINKFESIYNQLSFEQEGIELPKSIVNKRVRTK